MRFIQCATPTLRAAQWHGYPHAGTAVVHKCVDVGAALLKVDGYFGCGAVSLIFRLASFFEGCIDYKAMKPLSNEVFNDAKFFSFCISSAAVGTHWLRRWR